MRSDGLTGTEVRDRLGLYRVGERRAIAAVSQLVDGERLDAVGAGMWRRRGWLVVASDSGLRLVRRPYILGRARDEHFEWGGLTAVRTGASWGVTLTFDGRDLDVALLPSREFARLVDAARRRLPGDEASVTVETIRELALRELGRRRTLELDASIAAVPEQLEPGERLEAVAGATLGRVGLLVLTDRRLLLSEHGHRPWSVARDEIRSAAAVELGLWLDVGDEPITLTRIVPDQRRFELAQLLASPADVEGDPTPFRGPLVPSQPWELSAAEAFFLRYFDCDPSPEEVLRLALIELVARGALRIEGAWIRRRWAPGRYFAWLLCDGPRIDENDQPALASVLGLYEAARAWRPRIGSTERESADSIDGVLAFDLKCHAYGRTLGALGRDLAASLAEHGLLAESRLERTEAGQEADRQLTVWLRLGVAELPDRAGDHDTAWARAYLQGAGSAVLLAERAYPALAQLARREPAAAGWLDGVDLTLGVVNAAFSRGS